MAKLRRNNSKPSPAKKVKASAPAKKAQAKPAVKKLTKTPKPALKPVKKADVKQAKPVAKATKPPQKLLKAAPKTTPKVAAKPVAAPPSLARAAVRPPQAPPPPKRSTYADAVAMYERGMHALQAKRYKDAAEILRSVIAQFPEEKELHERAQLYIRVCERQMTPPDSTPKTADEYVLAATVAMNSGDVDRAIVALNAAITRDREHDNAAYMLGVALAIKGDLAGAISYITRAIDLNPDNREQLRNDSELDALRNSEEIKALLAAPPSGPRVPRRPVARVRFQR